MLLTSTLGLIITFFGFYNYSLKDEKQQEITITGTFKEYHQVDGYKSQTKQIIQIDNERYYIPTIYISAFKKDAFLKDVKKGKPVTLTLNGKSITQIKYQKVKYIDKSKLNLEVEKNQRLGLFMGIIFGLISIILLIKYFFSS